MNRTQRRARARAADPSGPVPVYGVDGRVIEFAGPARVRQLAKADNATVVRRHRDGRVERINLRNAADDSSLVKHLGNPLRYSSETETDYNPNGVWKLRYLPAASEDLYRLSISDNLVAWPLEAGAELAELASQVSLAL